MAETKMQLVDWLDDLCVRFIVNLPQEELSSVERICFQVEEAQWFYEDFIRPLDPSLPSMNLRKFCLLIFQHCPLLSQFSPYHHSAAYSEFLAYKTRVPVRGAIMLNDAMDEVVLVKGWKKGARWSFPRGKINKDEPDLDCAIREVYEETGFDVREAGLVRDESEMKYIEVSMREQHMRLYVFRGVPKDAHFEPRTRKEISKIQWYKLSELPTLKKGQPQGSGEDLLKGSQFYMVAPFLGPLKRWIKEQRKKDAKRVSDGALVGPEAVGPTELRIKEEGTAAENLTADEEPLNATNDEQAAAGHMDRLLAQLRTQRQVSLSNDLPEVSAAPEIVSDPAAELKRLLSVGQPVAAPLSAPKPQAVPSNDLLAMLRNGVPTSSNLLPNGGPPPRTPFEQMSTQPTQPRTPHHDQPRPPPFSSMPPPPVFPYSPVRLDGAATLRNAQAPYSDQQQHTSVPPTHYGPQMLSQIDRQAIDSPIPFAQQQTMLAPGGSASARLSGIHNSDAFRNMSSGLARQHQQTHQSTFPISDAATPQVPQAPLRPYQRTGDPQFAQAGQFPSTHAPAIPPASKLPPPKLNSHTMALLNAFKSSAKAPPTNPAGTAPQEVALTAQQTDPARTISATDVPPVSAGIHAPAPPLPVPGVPITRNDSHGGTEKRPDEARKMTNMHQAALLELFRSPGKAQTKPVAIRESAASLVPEPAELSAMPSTHGVLPGTTAEGPQTAPKATSMAGQIPLSALFGTVAPQKPGLTSATVSGPLNVPDFDLVHRAKPQKHQEDVHIDQRNVDKKRHEQKIVPQQPVRSPPTPITILQRPARTSNEGPSRHTPASVRAAAGPQRSPPEAPQPRPFRPLVLRRPQPTAPPGLPQAPSLDLRESLPDNQNNAPLPLLSKGAQGPTATAAGTPPYNAPAAISPLTQHSPSGDARNSGISSIASPPGNGAARTQIGGVTHSPITPVDRSSLLGYLEGVVKSSMR